MRTISEVQMKLVVESIKQFVENGDSLTLAKVKSMRKYKIDEGYAYEITADEEFKAMKAAYKTLHRFTPNWKHPSI